MNVEPGIYRTKKIDISFDRSGAFDLILCILTYRGTCTCYAYSTDDKRCPNEMGYTWKYSNSGWHDAGNALTVKFISETGDSHKNCFQRITIPKNLGS